MDAKSELTKIERDIRINLAYKKINDSSNKQLNIYLEALYDRKKVLENYIK